VPADTIAPATAAPSPRSVAKRRRAGPVQTVSNNTSPLTRGDLARSAKARKAKAKKARKPVLSDTHELHEPLDPRGIVLEHVSSRAGTNMAHTGSPQRAAAA